MKVPRHPKRIYFKNGNSMLSHELAGILAIDEMALLPDEVFPHINRRKTTKTALRQLLIYFDHYNRERETWLKEKNYRI